MSLRKKMLSKMIDLQINRLADLSNQSRAEVLENMIDMVQLHQAPIPDNTDPNVIIGVLEEFLRKERNG